MFRSTTTLAQKAGVAESLLPRLVLKELVDNALDAGGAVQIGGLDGGGFYVTDNGPGIAPEEVAGLFSINRPLVSTKLLRRPSRGALGNGLRVVMGAVAASDGRLEVQTRNKHIVLSPRDDGSTAAEIHDADFPVGTRVEITFGANMKPDASPAYWARQAIAFAQGGAGYGGKPSAWWYDGDAFFELLRAGGERPVRELVANLDGCTGAKAGQITAAFRSTPCCAMSRKQSIELLAAARNLAKEVRPERLGAVGPLSALPDYAYALRRGTFTHGGRRPMARLPFIIEVWARVTPVSAGQGIDCLVNRTPITGDLRAWTDKNILNVYGCRLNIEIPFRRAGVAIWLNVTTPYCPLTTDGKSPDLSYFENEIADAIKTCIRKARKVIASASGETRQTQKTVVLERLDEAVAKASGGGVYRFNSRQVYYVARPFVMEALGLELTWSNFTAILTDYENEHGDIPGMYRDPRGSFYHPHTRETMSLGTLSVEEYSRPEWTFNKVLFVEKEGFFEALKAAGWPETHDCALLTSKGYPTRALRDLLDLLGDGDEPLSVFCVHDADADGTMIYQALQEATDARPRRRVEIINLGLEPWEAVEMGLEVETVEPAERKRPVAEYLRHIENGAHWRAWLAERRVELNAMTTQQFIEWLNQKMTTHDGAKVIPPAEVIEAEARAGLAVEMRQAIADELLQAAGIDDLVAAAVAGIDLPPGRELVDHAIGWLAERPRDWWRDFVDEMVRKQAARRK